MIDCSNNLCVTVVENGKQLLNILKTKVFALPHDWNHEICIKCVCEVLPALKKEECLCTFQFRN